MIEQSEADKSKFSGDGNSACGNGNGALRLLSADGNAGLLKVSELVFQQLGNSDKKVEFERMQASMHEFFEIDSLIYRLLRSARDSSGRERSLISFKGSEPWTSRLWEHARKPPGVGGE